MPMLFRRTMLALALLGSVTLLPASGHAQDSARETAVNNFEPQTMLDKQLLQAAENGELEQIQTLLKSGASANATDGSGRTALTWAAWGNHVTVARALIAAGANPDPQD